MNSSSEPGPKNTFSQSGATTSLRSTITRSKPPPQVTMSLKAGLLTAPTPSLPSPAESLSVANSRSGPSITRSLPSSPNMLSEPRPPATKSLPGPPRRFLSPPEKPRSLPPRTISLPGPPWRLSLPARAKSMSLPPLPKRLSALLVPLRVSGPLVPTLLTARATPLARTRVKAIAVSRSTSRFMPLLSSRRAGALCPGPQCCPSPLRDASRCCRLGRHGRRRCGAGPGPGGAQDEGQEQQLESDGEAIEVGPGLPDRVEHREGDGERRHDEVRGAVDAGGQRRGEQDHEDRDRYGREEEGQQRLADVELKDDTVEDVVDDAGLVQGEVVDVDVEEHETGPGGRELRSDRYRRIVQCCRGLGVCAQGSLHRVEGGCAWIGPHRPPFVRCTSTVYMRLIMHHLLCQAIPSGSLLVRPYPYIRGRYMGDKYHVLHRHLSRLS